MSELPSLFRVGDELAMEPDNWLDQLLSSGALVEVVEVTIDYEALPSREELQTSDQDVWTHALTVASQNPAIDLTTAGVLDHLRHLIVTGQLVDRETELTEERFDVVSWTGAVGTPQVRRFVTALETVDAALGVSDE